MRLLGTGELAGLKARGAAKLEWDPILRNSRIREERQRAHMRALIAVPPRNFPRAELGRIELFHVELTRVAPDQHQLGEELPASLRHLAEGICEHLGVKPTDALRVRLEHRQAVGPWAVRFSVFDDSPTFEEQP